MPTIRHFDNHEKLVTLTKTEIKALRRSAFVVDLLVATVDDEHDRESMRDAVKWLKLLADKYDKTKTGEQVPPDEDYSETDI